MEVIKKGRAKLIALHPDMRAVIAQMETDWNRADLTLIVTCTLRTVEEQKALVKAGASKTMRSRHLKGKNGWSHAVDFAVMRDGKLSWDWPLYAELAKRMKAAAKKTGVPVEWGGDWKSFKDGPHFQLPRLTKYL